MPWYHISATQSLTSSYASPDLAFAGKKLWVGCHWSWSCLCWPVDVQRIKTPPLQNYLIIHQMKWLSSAIKKLDKSSPGGQYCHVTHTSCRSELSNYMLCRLDKRPTARYIDGAQRRGLIFWVIVVTPKGKLKAW